MFQLGGGAELAMMCDIILAAPTAVFGQPEINLGVIPGAGGSQRLTKAVGKSLAMELVLTGRNMSAEEAVAHGLASRIVTEGSVVDEAIKVGATISKKGQIAVQAGKEAVNACECGFQSSSDSLLVLNRSIPCLQRSTSPSPKAYALSDESSRASSQPRTRRREWAPLQRSERCVPRSPA